MSSLPNNFGAAFDLSALKNPARTESPSGFSITQENLLNEVLPASHQQVVIVICWSPRSPQSQAVMTALGSLHAEDAAKQGGSEWLLANVNVDTEPAVARALQVQTLPLALAIIQEQIVPLFETVPTAPQLRMVIDKVLSLASERGLGSAAAASNEPAKEPLEPEEAAALDALEAGNFNAAKDAYVAWLKRTPGNSQAQLGLAQVELMIRLDGVDIADVIAKADLDLSNFEIQMQAADAQMAQGEFGAAFTRLIEAIKISSGDDRKAIREHLVELFQLVDPSDPILIRARQQLASALY